jgi:ubiquinone/menaquinone biosynthesis C-methylase UbiE
MARADFGIDAPGVIRNMALLALAGLLLTVLLPRVIPGSPAAMGFSRMGATMSVVFAAQAAMMLWTSLMGKRIAARQLIDRAGLAGNERVLDVGCGRGLLLLTAAAQLDRGHAVGLDIWNSEDLSGNRREATLDNARALGLLDRIELSDGDMRAMPFEDASFDVVVSSLAVHNVYDPAGRARALAEIVRVLRPGGRLLLQDFRHTADYAAFLRDAGLHPVSRRMVNPMLMFPPTWRVEARR